MMRETLFSGAPGPIVKRPGITAPPPSPIQRKKLETRLKKFHRETFGILELLENFIRIGFLNFMLKVGAGT